MNFVTYFAKLVLFVLLTLNYVSVSFGMDKKDAPVSTAKPKQAGKKKPNKKKKKKPGAPKKTETAETEVPKSDGAPKTEESKLGTKAKPTVASPPLKQAFACIAHHDNEQLHKLLRNRRFKDLKQDLLKPHPECNEYAVHVAAENGNVEALKILHKLGCDFSVQNNIGTVFHIVACLNDLKTMMFLVNDLRLNPNECNQRGEKPIHYAASHKALDVLNYLLDNKFADIEEPNESKEIIGNASPLLLAAQHGAWPSMQLLLNRGANLCAQTRTGITCLEAAASASQELTVKLILEQDKKFIEAKKPGYTSIVNIRNDRGWSVLDSYTSKGNIPMMKCLISYGARVNPENSHFTPLGRAAYYNRHEAAKMLLTEYQANPNLPNSIGMAPIHDAAMKDDCGMIKLLVDQKADCNLRVSSAVANDEYTPLFFATMYKNLAAMKYLVTVCHADVNAVTSCCKRSALAIAFMKEFREGAEFLLDKGANTNYTFIGNRTLLHEAAHYGWTSVIEKLLARDFDVNEQDAEGHTALFYATQNDQKDAVALLVKHGATPLVEADEQAEEKAHTALEDKQAQAGKTDVVQVDLGPKKAEPAPKKPALKTDTKVPKVKDRIVVHDHLQDKYPHLEFTSAARRCCNKMDDEEEKVLSAVLVKVNNNNFGELKIKKLEGSKKLWRIRYGDQDSHRIIYFKNDGSGHNFTIVDIVPVNAKTEKYKQLAKRYG